MRLILLLLTLSLFPLISEDIYYDSNKSGMLLEVTDKDDKGDYYIVQSKDSVSWIISESFFSSGELKRVVERNYNPNFSTLIKVITTEGSSKKIEYYSGGRIDFTENYDGDDLNTIEKYNYNKSSQLIRLDICSSSEEIIYSDLFYRNRDGSLRMIKRTSEDGYQNYWYYIDGSISEFWHVSGNTKIATLYNDNGEIYNKKGFTDDVLSFEENLIYTEDGKLDKTVKVKGTVTEEKYYNESDLVEQYKVFDNGLLLRKHLYFYQDDFLIKEVINGHGKREEVLYTLDIEGEPVLTSYYENGKIVKNVIEEGENSQIIEFYKDENIYLKEFLKHGEILKTEYYLDGVLFKSESISE